MIDRQTVLNRIPDAARWYSISNAANDDCTVIRIFEEIGYWGITEERFARDLAAIDTPEIEVQISSPGGDVFAGLAIYNQLRAHPARVTTRIDGMAASAASFIVQAGDHRQIMSSAQMMIHEAWGLAIGSAADLREYADLLGMQNGVIADIYAARSGRDAEEFLELMKTDHFMTDAEALDLGLVDEIFDPPTVGSNNSRNSPRPSPPRSTQTPTGPQGRKERDMDYTNLRAEHGIAEEVTDADIAEVLAALAADDDPEPTPDPESEPKPEPDPEPDDGDDDGDPEVAALRSTVDTLTGTVATLTADRDNSTRETVLSAAVRAGKITPHDRASVWEPFYDANPAGATEALAKLPQIHPVGVEAGSSAGADDAEASAFAARRTRMTGHKEA